MDTLRSAVAPDVTVTARLEFDGRTYSLFYEGSEVVLRVIKGVDFQRERSLFSRFTYVPPEGSGEGFLPPFPELAGTNVILISNQLAGKLGVRQNDVVTFFCRTVQGYLNSVNLRVGGIFLDSSVLGLYTAYCDIEFLRDFYHAPLEFDRTRHGYFYSDVRSFLIFASGLALCYYLPGSHRKQAFVWLGWAVALYLSLLFNGVNTCSY